MNRKLFVLILAISLILCGCMKDDELWNFQRSAFYLPFNGLFVTNQGNFMYGNASLSYYDPESMEVLNDIFFNTNALPLGDVAQSMVVRDSLGYVVINNSGRIYIINVHTFEMIGKITGLTSPRYLHFIDDRKAYVTDLYARSISIVNPQSMELIGSIPVNNHEEDYSQHATEQMLQLDKYVYTNCWSYDNQILVIDSESDQVVDSIEVINQPNSMVLDRHQNLWVLCDGGFPDSPFGHELPGLMRIKAGSGEAEIVHRFSEGALPRSLKINGSGDTIYFINQGVYSFPVSSESTPELLIDSPYPQGYQGGFYALEVDPSSSELYVADAMDFVQRGSIYRYTPEGDLVDSFQAGIGPGGFCFKP